MIRAVSPKSEQIINRPTESEEKQDEVIKIHAPAGGPYRKLSFWYLLLG